MKPKLLLHSCCGPCSTSVLERLVNDYSVSVYFYNPNIYPKEEYKKRLETEKRFCERVGVELVEGEYDHENWLACVRGLEKEPEGGSRCEKCFRMRMESTSKAAQNKGFESFTVTLSVSPHKNYDLISSIGSSVEIESGIKFLNIDFKKRAGFTRSIEISKEHDLYRQKYCGCEFSIPLRDGGASSKYI